MSALPFMKFYTDDYLADTIRLRPFEHGVYLLLILEYWRTEGPLIDDDDELSEICRCSIDEFKKSKNKIIKYFKIVDGALVHNKIERILSESLETHKKRSEAGKKGGKATNKPGLSNDKAGLKPGLSNQNQNQNQNQN